MLKWTMKSEHKQQNFTLLKTFMNKMADIEFTVFWIVVKQRILIGLKSSGKSAEESVDTLENSTQFEDITSTKSMK